MLTPCLSIALLLAPAAEPERPKDYYPRTLDEVRKQLAELAKLSAEADKGKAERLAALNRLRAYRFLASVPWEDVTLDDHMNRAAQAAADLCAKLGRIDHAPKNPGLSEAEFKLAYEGTTHS